MKFHLGIEAFKVHINNQAFKVHLGNDLPVIQHFEEFMLTVQWRPGIESVEVERVSSLNPNAVLGQIYTGDKIYAGDVLSVAAYATAGTSIQDYEKSITVTGDTLVYIEPTTWTYAYATQEITFPSGDVVEVTLNSTHSYEFNADFALQVLCNNSHWGYCTIAEELLTEEQFVDLYNFDTYPDAGYQEVISVPEDEASYIKTHGEYIGSIWIGPEHSWYVTLRSELING